MSDQKPTPKEQSVNDLERRMTVQKIENGYLAKVGIMWVFCATLEDVLVLMKKHFESLKSRIV